MTTEEFGLIWARIHDIWNVELVVGEAISDKQKRRYRDYKDSLTRENYGEVDRAISLLRDDPDIRIRFGNIPLPGDIHRHLRVVKAQRSRTEQKSAEAVVQPPDVIKPFEAEFWTLFRRALKHVRDAKHGGRPETVKVVFYLADYWIARQHAQKSLPEDSRYRWTESYYLDELISGFHPRLGILVVERINQLQHRLDSNAAA